MLTKLSTRNVAGGKVTLVWDADEQSWGVMVELEGVEWKVNYHTDEQSARREFRSYARE